MRPEEQRPRGTTVPAAEAWASQNHVRTVLLTAVTLGGAYLCRLVAFPFLSALTWALAFAVVVAPFHRQLEARLSHRNLAGLITVLIVALTVVVPASFVGERLVREATKGAELVRTKIESGEWRQALAPHPRLAPLADWMERQNLPATVKTLAGWMTTSGASFIKGSVAEGLGLLLTFYLLFFFLRDRNAGLEMLRTLAPLSDSEMDLLLSRVGDTICATVYGTLVVSAVQGFLGGLMFWWLGLPAPLLWGVVMALLAVVPVLGAFIVWVPAALFLGILGSWGMALSLVVWGGGVVGSIDNLLRPVLVGNRLKLHTVLAFISVVGGVLAFGASGLILGPVVLAVTSVLLEIWRGHAAAEVAEPERARSSAVAEGAPGSLSSGPSLPACLPPGIAQGGHVPGDREQDGRAAPALPRYEMMAPAVGPRSRLPAPPDPRPSPP